MYVYEFDCYERAVRAEDSNPDVRVINCYIHLGLEQAMRCKSALATKVVYLRMLSTLEEALCDPLLSQQWRQYCFKAIKRLMPLIYEITNDNEYTKLNERIVGLAAYFLPKHYTM